MKKLLAVIVSWKYSIKTGPSEWNILFPKVRCSGDELIGKTRWSDRKRADFALKEFVRQKGFEPEQRDLFVERYY